MDVGDNPTGSAEIDLRKPSKPVMGAVLILRGRQPVNELVRWEGKTLRIGRTEGNEIRAAGDHECSRFHAEVRYLGDGVWEIRDLGSKYGSYVNGMWITGVVAQHRASPWLVVRCGGTIALLGDLQWYGMASLEAGEIVMSPRLVQEYRFIAAAASCGRTTLIRGETGTGKEHAAEHYRLSSPLARGPSEVVNCANLKGDTTTSELFGADKGGHSTADRTRKGAFERNEGGVLCLDEIGELGLEVQPELLRVVQQKTILRLGGDRPQKLTFHLVCSTHKDLEAEVAAGRFRQDLYQRLMEAQIVLPPLRDRLEEIAWLIAKACGDRKMSAEFVEACLLEPWPGNVRELLNVVGRAAMHARATGSPTLFMRDFNAAVGREMPEVEEPPAEGTGQVEEARAEEPKAKVRTPRDPEKYARFFAEYDAHGDIKRAMQAAGVTVVSTAYEWVKERRALKK